jgi:asparagine synthase (glutamine-hydrolysing)
MCGIAGYFTVSPSPSSPTLLEKMIGTIEHRGPDAHGTYHDDHAHLGHRRLSIVDLSEAGRQPMANEDGRVQIVFNGEIFNHASIRPELEAAGHRYRSHSDTETILHGWEQWGPAVLERFRGMFAFTLWDTARQTLFCARDRMGIKPFYYWWDGRTFVFGSEVKALLAHPDIRARFNESQLSEYLAFGYLSGEETLFEGIRQLPPGHHLTIRLDQPAPAPVIARYWQVPEPVREERSDAEWIADCRRRLEETVRMRLMSDVPLGMFLSGGVDSSAIAALMKRMVSGPVKTFAVGYSEAAYSELSYARQVAGRIGTEHHEVVVGAEEFFNALPRLVWHEDFPITWPSSVSLYFVSRLARQQVTVVLTGEGSDELFAGYNRYRFYRWNRQAMDYYGALPAGLRRGAARWIESSSLLPGSLRRKLGHTFLARGGDLESLYLDNFYSGFSGAEQQRLFRLPRHAPYQGFLRHWEDGAGRELLPRLLYTDLHTYLVQLLMKQDRMSMACSIESRVPFLDHTFVEFSTRVPDHLKIRGREGKYILKKAVEDLLPHDILYRPKMGFPTPLRDWLRGPHSAALVRHLTRRDSLLSEYIEPKPLENLLARHSQGKEDATDRIWRLLTLQIWGDLFLCGRRDAVWNGLLQNATV